MLSIEVGTNGPVAVAFVASLALAALTWLHNRRSLLYATLGFALVFAVFDIAEIAHQINESRAGLAAVAAALPSFMSRLPRSPAIAPPSN